MAKSSQQNQNASSKKDEGQQQPPQEIDLSSVANAEAVQQKDPTYTEVAENASSRQKKRKSNKFNFAESELVPLPSGGRLYKNVTDDEDIIKHGHIRMLPMTLKEEEILSTQKFLRQGIATRMILDRCIESNIDAKDVLLFDSNFLMFYLRKISYGDEYTFEIKCENPACGKKFHHTVNISELAFEELPEEVKEPIKIQLPKSKYTVEIILPRLYHSEEIFMRNNNRKKTSNDADQRMLDNFYVTTIRITDPDGEEVPEADWEDFYEALPGLDIATLREKTQYSTGIDELPDIECPYCGESFDGSVPIGADFFRF